MTYLLLLIFFNENVETAIYQTKTQCESALFEATDAGRYKLIRVAQCLPIQPKKG